MLPARLVTTITAAAVSSPCTTGGLWTGFIHIQCPAVHIRSVQGCDGLVGFAGIAHFDKCKTSCLPRVTICNNVHSVNTAVGFKKRTNLLFASLETEVSYKDIFHLYFFLI
jgi:hypothetical protein